MGTPNSWKCPGCGTAVTMPAALTAAEKCPEDRCLDQLAQALCGCWVRSLPDDGMNRLMRVIMSEDEVCK